MPDTAAQHWAEVYTCRGDTQVSWFTPDPACSLELIGAADPLRRRRRGRRLAARRRAAAP